MGGHTVRTTTNLVANLDPLSSTSANFFTIISPNSSSSSSSSSNLSNNIQHISVTSAQRHLHDDKDDENDSQRSNGSSIDSVFGSVPTRIEVEYALSAFQSFMMQGLTSTMSVLDRIQPMVKHNDPRILHSSGFQRICHAFRLLQTVPAIQRMVVSISSDKAVWDAVMTNTEVQNFRQSFMQAESGGRQRSNDEPNLVSMILRWILDKMKLKILELIETLKTVLSKNFESPQKENSNQELNHGFEEMIVSTVLLSTITLMIVLVTRAYGTGA